MSNDIDEINDRYNRGGMPAVILWVVRELFAAFGVAIAVVMLVVHYATGHVCQP